MEGAHRSSRGWVSFLLSPPPSSLASLCPRNKSAPAVVPKRQMRTCDCLAYSGGLNPAPLPFSCPGNPARREPRGPPSRCLSQEPKHFCLLRPLLAEAKRGGGWSPEWRTKVAECAAVHPGPRRSRVSAHPKDTSNRA